MLPRPPQPNGSLHLKIDEVGTYIFLFTSSQGLSNNNLSLIFCTDNMTSFQDYKSPFTSVITSADKARFNTGVSKTTDNPVKTSPSPPNNEASSADESKA